MEKGSTSLGSTSGSRDLLNGLRFGQKIYFEDVGCVVNSSPSSPPASAPSSELDMSSSKKGRGIPLVNRPPRCQVEGCNEDLTGAKAYYCRHKVCGVHSKSPKVIVAGLEQRFCQQCSRFHLLAAFDQGKRSCRRRLAGHNERRRKPPPGSLLSTRYAHDSFSIHDASRLGGFWDFPYARFPRRDVMPTSRDVNRVPCNEVTSSGKFLSNLCQGGFNTSVNVSTHMAQPYLQSLFGGTSLSGSETQAGECFSAVSDSGCALSLLSTQQWGQRNRSSGLSNYMNNDITLIPQPISHDSVSTTTCNAWSFRSHEAGGNSDNLELQQVHCSVNSSRFFRQSELDEPVGRQYMNSGQSRACDSTTYQMNWSL